MKHCAVYTKSFLASFFYNLIAEIQQKKYNLPVI